MDNMLDDSKVREIREGSVNPAKFGSGCDDGQNRCWIGRVKRHIWREGAPVRAFFHALSSLFVRFTEVMMQAAPLYCSEPDQIFLQPPLNQEPLQRIHRR